MSNEEKGKRKPDTFPSRLGPRDWWAAQVLLHSDEDVHDFVPQAPVSKGEWLIDFMTYAEHKEKFGINVIPLRTKEDLLGIPRKIKQQIKEWEKILGGPVTFLMVADGQQKGTPWLAQPVREDWITIESVDALQAQFQFATVNARPELLPLRAALLARGVEPSLAGVPGPSAFL